MPDEGWVLCLEVDRDEIYTATRIMLGNSMLLTLASALVVGLIIFAARAIARMLRGISGIAEAVAEGRLEANANEKALLYTANKRNDEFSNFAAGMENMIENIKNLLHESEQKARDRPAGHRRSQTCHRPRRRSGPQPKPPSTMACWRRLVSCASGGHHFYGLQPAGIADFAV